MNKIISGRNVSSPVIVIGADSGQSKFSITASVFDDDNMEEDGEKSGGINRTVVICSAQDVPESHHNAEILFNLLKLWTLPWDFKLVCDLKLAAILCGKILFKLNPSYNNEP